MRRMVAAAVAASAILLLGSVIALAEDASESVYETEDVTEGVLDEISSDEYLETTSYTWFATGKINYSVQGKMVSENTEVYNFLEDVNYVAEPNGEDVILKGNLGEEWVSNIEKVIKTYTDAEGNELTADVFTPDIYVDLVTIPTTGNFACFIPADIKVSVETAWGDILHANRDGVPHGDGDYLVCREGEDGEPDLSDVWVVNGEQFVVHYDMTNADADTEAVTEGQSKE